MIIVHKSFYQKYKTSTSFCNKKVIKNIFSEIYHPKKNPTQELDFILI